MKNIILVLLVAACLRASAQEVDEKIIPDNKSVHSSFETDYFRLFNEGWALQPFLSLKSFIFKLKNNSTGRDIYYEPAVNFSMGLRGVYKGYGAELSFAVPQKGDPATGKSEYVDFQFMLPLKTQGFDFIYQKYTGFHIKDKDLKVGDEYLQYPDLYTTKLAVNYYYAFNHDFSLKAGFNQTARQLQSAGSWMLMGSLNMFIMSNPDSVIPALYSSDFATVTGLEALRFTGVGASGGYAYTFVDEDAEWFLTMGLFLGFNSELQSYTISTGTYEQKVLFNPRANLKISGGKQSDKMYFGFSWLIEQTIAAATDIEVEANSLSFNIFWGYRL